jgi:hypothetical protein
MWYFVVGKSSNIDSGGFKPMINFKKFGEKKSQDDGQKLPMNVNKQVIDKIKSYPPKHPERQKLMSEHNR